MPLLRCGEGPGTPRRSRGGPRLFRRVWLVRPRHAAKPSLPGRVLQQLLLFWAAAVCALPINMLPRPAVLTRVTTSIGTSHVLQGLFSVARRFYLLFQHHTTDAFNRSAQEFLTNDGS